MTQRDVLHGRIAAPCPHSEIPVYWCSQCDADRHGLSSGVNASELAGSQGGTRPREIDRGAVGSYRRPIEPRMALGRAYCLVCGAPLGDELQHIGPPTLMGRIYAAAP